MWATRTSWNDGTTTTLQWTSYEAALAYELRMKKYGYGVETWKLP